MTGLPEDVPLQATPCHLSPPERAKALEISLCPDARILTEKVPAARIFGQLVELCMTLKETKGGSSERLWNDWQVNPTGCPSDMPAMTVMPEA